MKTYKRAPSQPLPTVAQIEDSLDILIRAFCRHEKARKRKWPKGQRYWSKSVRVGNTDTEYLPYEEYIDDPIGYSLYEGIQRLGETLYALCDDDDAMIASLHRLGKRDEADEERRSILDHFGGRFS